MKSQKKRGRPSKLDFERAAQTAMRLFWQKGYDSVGIAELSDALGVGPPAIYSAFGSKLGLLRAASELYAQGDGSFVVAAAQTATSTEELLRSILMAAAKAYTISPETRGCLVLDGTRNSADAEARAHMWSMRLATRDFLATQYERVGSGDPKELAEYTLVAMTGLSGSARDGVSRDQLVRCASRLASD